MNHSSLLRDTDQCVKCALCLPHCPTYAHSQQEGDSPRGRIALVQGLASGTITATPRLIEHVDGCLSCRACEPVCPAQVPYSRILDGGRALLPSRSGVGRVMRAVLASRAARKVLELALGLYQHLRLQALLRALRFFGLKPLTRLDALLPRWHVHYRKPSAPLASSKPKVQLFTGCASELFDGQTLRDTQLVLERFGFAVEVPRAQACCGALHQHGGDLPGASALARRNTAAFAGETPVLCTASGCAATLRDYGDLAEAPAFALRVTDICSFLLQHWPKNLVLAAKPERIALHRACTAQNVLKSADAARQLLERLPGAEVLELDAKARCCGAAGAAMIERPEEAAALREPKLAAAAQLKPDLIASQNIGCALHLAAGLRSAGLTAPVCHPVTVLARRLAGG